MKDLVTVICVGMGALGGVLGLLVGMSALLALPVMCLWNGLCPNLFELPEIRFMQAWGLSLLSGLLFRSTIPKQS